MPRAVDVRYVPRCRIPTRRITRRINRGGRVKKLVLVVSVLALAVSACQAASEQLTEQILEQQDGVSDVEFDADTGQVSLETDEGSISIGGGEVPSGFAVPFPDGYAVASVFDTDADAAVSVTYPSDRYDELVTFYDDWTSGQSGEWNRAANTFDSADGQTIRATSWNGDGTQLGVTDCPSFTSDDEYQVCVTAAVEK